MRGWKSTSFRFLSARNADRFPDEFLLRLTNQEVASLKSQIPASCIHGARRGVACTDMQGVRAIGQRRRDEGVGDRGERRAIEAAFEASRLRRGELEGGSRLVS